MDGDLVGHAQLSFGSSAIMLGSVRDDYGRMVGTPGDNGGKSVYVAVDDCDAAYAKAKAAGATILEEPRDRDYGSREFICADPEGNVWSLAPTGREPAQKADPLAERSTILLAPGEGRRYDMRNIKGRLQDRRRRDRRPLLRFGMVVKPGGNGPGAHMHEANDEVFYGIAGKMSVLADDIWHDLTPGGFIRVPAGMVHDFRNRTSEPAAVLNVFIPGGFERHMPAIVKSFGWNA